MIVKVIGMNVPVESHPSNEFVYAWNNDEILRIIGGDSRIETTLRTNTLASDDVKIENVSTIMRTSLKTEACLSLTISHSLLRLLAALSAQ